MREPAGTETIRVGIADDEPLARERLRRLVVAESDMTVVALSEEGDAAVAACLADPPDLLFLDVGMPKRDGFAVAAALLDALPPERMPLVVFVTAYDQHALRAFEAQALDYLVKPFDDERFAALLARVRRLVRRSRVEAATERLRELLAVAAPASRPGPPEPAPGGEEAHGDGGTAAVETHEGRLERLVLRVGRRSRLVRAEHVDWIGADGVYARIHVNGASFLIRVPMHELEARLDPARFVRIHRSTIVNLDRISEIHEVDRGEFAVLLRDGSQLKLSRSRRAHLESKLGQGL